MTRNSDSAKEFTYAYFTPLNCKLTKKGIILCIFNSSQEFHTFKKIPLGTPLSNERQDIVTVYVVKLLSVGDKDSMLSTRWVGICWIDILEQRTKKIQGK